MNELLNNTVLRFYLLLIFLWGFLKGLRNYLTHLADDYEHDSKSGLQTLAIKYDSSKIQVLANLLYPAEVFCLSVIVYKASGLNYIAVLPCLFFSGIWIWHILKNRAQKCETLNDLHEVWLPVLLITLLVSNNTAFYPLVIVHILLFSYHLYKIYCLLDLIYLHTLFKIIGPIRKKGK